MTRTIFAAVIAAAAAGCSAVPEGKTGNLGKGGFQYRCVTADEDQACDGVSPGAADPGPSKFPALIAAGGSFRLVFNPASDQKDVGNPSLRPVSSDFLLAKGGERFEAKKAGTCGVVARSSVNGNVVDYTYVHIADVAKLSVTTSDGSVIGTGFGITRGDGEVGITVTPLDARGAPLAGEVDYHWSIDDTTKADFSVASPLTRNVSLVGKAPGTANVTVGMAHASTTFQVTVQ
jgi:hypothetical protein